MKAETARLIRVRPLPQWEKRRMQPPPRAPCWKQRPWSHSGCGRARCLPPVARRAGEARAPVGQPFYRPTPLPTVPHTRPPTAPLLTPPRPLSRTSRLKSRAMNRCGFTSSKLTSLTRPRRYAHSASRAIPAAPTTSPPTRLQRSAQFRAAATFAPAVRADHAPGHDAARARENRCVSSSGVDNTSKCN